MITILHFLTFLLYGSRTFCLSQELGFVDEDIVFRVMNGRPANIGEVPYQVAIMNQKGRTNTYRTFCGGSIIKPDSIISAAHCFERKGNFNSKALKHLYAVAGILNSSANYEEDSYKNGQWRKIKKLEYPENYHFPYNDFIVAITNTSYVFNDHISAIPYSREFKHYKGPCFVSGYGRTSRHGKKQSERLLIAELQLIPQKRCNELHKRNMTNFICTSTRIANVGKGDSGSPLICKNTADPREGPSGILVGVVCGRRFTKDGDVSFFTRVSSYRTLIKEPPSLPLKEKKSKSYCLKHNIMLLDFIGIGYLIYKSLFRF